MRHARAVHDRDADRTERLTDRRKMMQVWADYLEQTYGKQCKQPSLYSSNRSRPGVGYLYRVLDCISVCGSFAALASRGLPYRGNRRDVDVLYSVRRVSRPAHQSPAGKISHLVASHGSAQALSKMRKRSVLNSYCLQMGGQRNLQRHRVPALMAMQCREVVPAFGNTSLADRYVQARAARRDQPDRDGGTCRDAHDGRDEASGSLP